MSKTLLKEYLLEALNEDDFAGLDNTGPWGASFGSNQDLYNVFIRPFSDVAKTASAETKKMSVRAQTLLKTTFEAVASTFLPFLSADYDKIFEREKEELDKIKNQYKDVYDATWSVFKDNDVALMAFFYSPSAFITAKTVEQAPAAAVSLINVLAGGKLDGFLQKVKKAFSMGSKKDSDVSGPGIPEGVLREDKIGQVLSQPKLLKIVKSSSKTRALEDQTQKIVNAGLQTIVNRATSIKNAKDLNQLQKFLDKNAINKLNKLPQEQRKSANEMLLTNLKKMSTEFYVKNLTAQAQNAVKAGISREHPFVQAYLKAIQTIKS